MMLKFSEQQQFFAWLHFPRQFFPSCSIVQNFIHVELGTKTAETGGPGASLFKKVPLRLPCAATGVVL